MKNKYLKRVMAMTAVTALCMTATLPAMAATGGVETLPQGTEIKAGVMVENPNDKDARIRVTVPTLFAFVVNGKANDATALTSAGANKSIFLPNVQVSNVNGGAYDVGTIGSNVMTFANYSTSLKTGDVRTGIPLKLTGSIQNEGSEASRNGWTHTASATATAKKQYNVSVGGEKFDKPAGNNTLAMSAAIDLTAPDVAAGGVDGTTGLANVGAENVVAFDVAVGGTRGDYTTSENSAKVGTIVWSVTHAVPEVPAP